ncbi:MAG: hypothetical protein ACREQD_07235, partial [Candidatus Binataceae bacterium]
MGASLEPARALPSDARSAHHTRSARIALYVTLTFGFLVPLLNLPGLSPLLQHSFSISRTLAWGWVGIFDKLFLLFFIPLAVVFWERRPLSSIGVQRPTLTEASLGLPIFLLTEIAALLMSMFLMLLLGLFGVHAMGAEVRRFGASASLLALPIW